MFLFTEDAEDLFYSCGGRITDPLSSLETNAIILTSHETMNDVPEKNKSYFCSRCHITIFKVQKIHISFSCILLFVLTLENLLTFYHSNFKTRQRNMHIY